MFTIGLLVMAYLFIIAFELLVDIRFIQIHSKVDVLAGPRIVIQVGHVARRFAQVIVRRLLQIGGLFSFAKIRIDQELIANLRQTS